MVAGMNAPDTPQFTRREALKIIGAGVAQLHVERIEVRDAYQHEAARFREMFTCQYLVQVRQKVLATGQPGNGIPVDFPAQSFQSGGLLSQHGFDPCDHVIHGPDNAAQFGGAWLFNCEKVPLCDGFGLAHYVF